MDFFTSAKARTLWYNIKNSYTDTTPPLGPTVDFYITKVPLSIGKNLPVLCSVPRGQDPTVPVVSNQFICDYGYHYVGHEFSRKYR